MSSFETSWALCFDIVDGGIVEKESRYLITGRFPEQPDCNAGQSLQAIYNTTNTSRFLSMPGKPALRLQTSMATSSSADPNALPTD
jgi:hypothetical protein